jgi:hypothetical protein
MNINELNELPDWKDDNENDDGENWKPNETKSICKQLYQKWNEILMMINGAIGNADKTTAEAEATFLDNRKSLMLGDAYQVGAKIRSSEAGDMYILRMENAAIIRKNAQFVKSSILMLVIEGEIDEEHGELIRTEIDVFREMFISWVKSFKKDDYSDEWGLFN